LLACALRYGKQFTRESVSCGSVPSTVGFDQGIVAQDGDPGILMAAGRLFAECGRELIGIHEALALGGQVRSISGAQDGSGHTTGKPLGRCGRRRRHFAGCPEAVCGCHHQAIALGDIADRAQIFAPGIKMPAARLEARRAGSHR
jgi:hypothetical protein